MKKDYPKKVKIVEVGPRDGLQNESEIILTKNKVEFIKKLAAAGLKDIELTSFVSPKWVAQLADAKEVVAGIDLLDTYFCLIPNMKGFERALETGIKKIAIVTSASETFNQKNINMSIEESIKGYSEVLTIARKNNVFVRGYLSTCFVCPYEGEIDKNKVVEVTSKLLDLGVDEISFGDTIGAASPLDVYNLLPSLIEKISIEKIALHFHDTYGTALSNVVAGLDLGISIFDSSCGGLGGCPYAPGASGNLATEDLVYLLDRMQIQTGVDINKLFEASMYIEKFINKQLPSKQFQRLKTSVI